MKFPRTARILRSHFDVAPFAAVFFLLVIFLMMGGLLPVQGLRMSLNPPVTDELPGVSQRTIAMAVDASGRIYFENEIVTESQLKTSLRAAVAGSREPLTLIIHADKAVTYDQLAHLSLLARDYGLSNCLLATLPRAEAKP
jgi:biopolymer transport protein TolR